MDQDRLLPIQSLQLWKAGAGAGAGAAAGAVAGVGAVVRAGGEGVGFLEECWE